MGQHEARTKMVLKKSSRRRGASSTDSHDSILRPPFQIPFVVAFALYGASFIGGDPLTVRAVLRYIAYGSDL